MNMEALKTAILNKIGREPAPGFSFVILDANRMQRGVNDMRDRDDVLPVDRRLIAHEACILSGHELHCEMNIDWRYHRTDCSVWEIPTSIVGRWRLSKRAIACDIIATTPMGVPDE